MGVASVDVCVRKYGQPTLVEEVEGRLLHTVTITARKALRGKEDMALIEKFRSACTCDRWRFKRAKCIHWGLVMMTHFS